MSTGPACPHPLSPQPALRACCAHPPPPPPKAARTRDACGAAFAVLSARAPPQTAVLARGVSLAPSDPDDLPNRRVARREAPRRAIRRVSTKPDI